MEQPPGAKAVIQFNLTDPRASGTWWIVTRNAIE